MGDKIFASVESAFMARLVCKVYWSVTNLSQVKSEYVVSSQPAWMDVLKLILVTPVPPALLAACGDNFESCQAIKAKKWTFQILRRFITRFATPRVKVNGEEENPFAVSFGKHKSRCACPCVCLYVCMYVRVSMYGCK